MLVVVEHGLERPGVDHCLAVVAALALLALVGRHGHRPELDPLHHPPGRGVPLDQVDPVEAGLLERGQESLLLERPGDTSAPQFGVGAQVLGHLHRADDVGDHRPAATAQHPEDLGEQPQLVLGGDQVEHTVADHHVHRVVGHQRLLGPQPLLLGLQRGQRPHVGDRVDGEPATQGFEVQGEILDAALAEFDVAVPDPLGHLRGGASGQREHVVVEVDADHLAGRADDLGGDEADLPATAAQVQHGLTWREVTAGIPAAVIPLEYLGRDDLQPRRVVVDRAAQRRLHLLCPGTVTLRNRLLHPGGRDHSRPRRSSNDGVLPVSYQPPSSSSLNGDLSNPR